MRRFFEPVALKMYAACAGVPASNQGCGAEIWTSRDTASRRAGTIIAPHPFLYAWQSAVSSKKTQKLAPVFSVNVTTSYNPFNETGTWIEEQFPSTWRSEEITLDQAARCEMSGWAALYDTRS